MTEIYKKKTSREHILERPNMYIGANNLVKNTEFVLDNDRMVQKEIEYVPGLLKIINEIIDNSVDIAIKTDFKGCNEISVKMYDDYVEVVDNGPGIPVKKNEDGEYIPFVCWGYAMSGSNFDNDESRKAIGMNGVGSYCTNVWSKKFTGISDDGQNRYEITFKDNASTFVDTVKKSTGHGVSVKFYPDLERFGLEKITQEHIDLIKQRLINLNMSFPKITFKFNGKKIGISSFKKYVQMFGENYEIYEDEKYCFAILPSGTDDFQQFSYVNGLNIKDGGTHIDAISGYFSYGIRDALIKKYKTLKPADIKNRLQVVAFLRDFINPKFNSQTKEKITNSSSEVNAYYNADWSKVLKLVLKNQAIIGPIVDVFKIKEELKRKAEMKSIAKPKKIKNDKYIPANKENKYLMITEGECLSENTKILMSNFTTKKLKDISIGEKILNNNFEETTIISKTSKLTKTLKIKTKDDDTICGLNHPFFVYNTVKKIFEFVKASELNKNVHKLVKSKINEESRFFRVEYKDGYKIFFENECLNFTDDDKFIIIRNKKILKIKSCDLEIGDCIIIAKE